jgi:hypothetical protein
MRIETAVIVVPDAEFAQLSDVGLLPDSQDMFILILGAKPM